MANLATARVDSHGGISAFKNTRRVFVSPAEFQELAVTATFTLQQTSNVPELFTADLSSTNIFGIPLPAEFSNAKIEKGGSAVDRGIRVVGLEIMYHVENSALGAMTFDIFKLAFAAADGAVTATTVTSTDAFLPAGNDGTEVDVHRISTVIAESDRFFLDGDTVVYCEWNVTDGTASDLTVTGAIWHLERTEE